MEHSCSICKKSVSEKVYKYSINHFNKVLCFNHQKEILPERFYCSFCKQKISEKVNKYSTKYFGKSLCLNHQKYVNQTKINSIKKIISYKKRHYCSDCNKTITYPVFSYSFRRFNKPLCMDCQPVIVKTISVSPRKRELNEPAGIEIGGKLPKDKKIYDGY